MSIGPLNSENSNIFDKTFEAESQTGEYVYQFSTSTPGIAVASSRGGKVEKRTGSFANDGRPFIENRGTSIAFPTTTGEGGYVYGWAPPKNGTVQNGFDMSGTMGDLRGMTWTGSELLLLDNDNDYVYQTDRSGNVNDGFSISSTVSNPSGLDYSMSGTVFTVNNNPDVIYEFDLTGTLQNTLNNDPIVVGKGIAEMRHGFLVADNGPNYVYRLNTDSSTVGNGLMGGFGNLTGSVGGVEYDGRDAWVLKFGGVYRFNLEHKPSLAKDSFSSPSSGTLDSICWDGRYIIVGDGGAYVYMMGESHTITGGLNHP